MSLIEVLTTMGLIGGVMVAVFALNEVQTKSIRGNRVIASRDNLRNLVERFAQDPTAIGKSAVKTSLAGNAALYSCLVGTEGPRPSSCAAPETKCCRTGSTTTPQPFSIVDPADPTGNTLFSGTEAASSPLEATTLQPIRYDDEGNNCTASGPSSRCPIELYTSFVAKCAGTNTTCVKAESIQIIYTIKHADGAAATSGSRLKQVVSRPLPLNLSSTFQAAAEAAAVAGIPGPTPTPGSSSSSGSAPAAAVLYLRVRHGDTAPACPAPLWTEAAYSNEYVDLPAGQMQYNQVRTCVSSNGSCVVMYLKSTSYPPPSCPTTWTSAAELSEIATSYTSFNGSGGASAQTYYNWVRPCYKCN